MSSWSGPYARQPRTGKGKGSKGWICSEECFESLVALAPTSASGSATFQISPAPPPLGSDLREDFVLEVREWLRLNFTVAERDVLFS